jgi:general secretion pathway protein G
MKKMNLKKRFMTLIEMMIVMFLIAMITGVIAYNYTGSLEEGKAFKTKVGMQKIKDILALEGADRDISTLKQEWQEIVRNSLMVQNAPELLKDGWGGSYRVESTGEQDDQLEIISDKYDAYLKRTNKSSRFQKN